MLQNSDLIHEMYFFVMKRSKNDNSHHAILLLNEKYMNKIQMKSIIVFVVIYVGTYLLQFLEKCIWDFTEKLKKKGKECEISRKKLQKRRKKM